MSEILNIFTLVDRTYPNEITAYQTGGTSIPPDGGGKRYVSVSDDEVASWRSAQQTMTASGRSGCPLWDGVNRLVVIPPDLRPVYNIISDNVMMDVSDQTPTTLTVSCTSDPSYTGSVIFDMGSRRIQVNLVNGTGVKQVYSSESGVWGIVSTNNYRLENPVQLEAVE